MKNSLSNKKKIGGQFNKSFISVAFVLESENSSYTCKLHLQKFYEVDPWLYIFVPGEE